MPQKLVSLAQKYSISPYSLDGFLLRITEGTGAAPCFGPEAPLCFVRTGDHPAYRHLKVPFGICFSDPMTCIFQPVKILSFYNLSFTKGLGNEN